MESFNEIRFLASFSHPNIIKYYDSFFENGKLYIVMEYASSGDLAKLITKTSTLRRTLDETRIWTYLIQILLGISALHKKSVIHRVISINYNKDIKARNIFIGEDDRLFVGDLGCSRIMDKEFLLSQAGTPYYMCPEIVENKPYDLKADVWSVGIVLYELMTLKVPFNGKVCIKLK